MSNAPGKGIIRIGHNLIKQFPQFRNIEMCCVNCFPALLLQVKLAIMLPDGWTILMAQPNIVTGGVDVLVESDAIPPVDIGMEYPQIHAVWTHTYKLDSWGTPPTVELTKLSLFSYSYTRGEEIILYQKKDEAENVANT